MEDKKIFNEAIEKFNDVGGTPVENEVGIQPPINEHCNPACEDETQKCGDCQTGCEGCQCSNQGCQNCQCYSEGCQDACEWCENCEGASCQTCQCSSQLNQTPTGAATIINSIITKTSISLTYKASGNVNEVVSQCNRLSDGALIGTQTVSVAVNGTVTVTFTGLTLNTAYTIYTLARKSGSFITSYSNNYTTANLSGSATITSAPLTKTSINLNYQASGDTNQIEVQCYKVSDSSSVSIKTNNLALGGTTSFAFTGLNPSTAYKMHTICRNGSSYLRSFDNNYTTSTPVGTIASNGYGSDGTGTYLNMLYCVTGDVDNVGVECRNPSGTIVGTGYSNISEGDAMVAFHTLTPNTTYTINAQATYLGIPVATLTTEVKTPNSLEITKLEIANIPDLGIGETYQLIPIFTPPNTSSKSVIYEITDKTIVDRETYDGNIKALKPGTTYIKASSSQNPNISVTKTVTVKPTGTISIENIRKTALSISFDVITTGHINKIFVHSYDKEMEGQSQYTEDENHKIIQKFTTGKTSITFEALEPDTEHRIEVDAAFNGYTVFDPDNKQIGVKCIIDTIKTDKFIPVTGISFEVPSIKTEQTVVLKGEAIPYNATLNSITFSTDNATIANVENGILKANKAGDCNIIATSKEYSRRKINCPSMKVSKKLTVQPGGTITLLSHTKDDDSISLVYKTTGDTNKIKASCVNSTTNESQNPIEINANGQSTITFNNLKSNTDYKITAVAYMSTIILSSTPTITIKTSITNVTGITFDNIPTLSVGKSHALIASVSPYTATDKRIEFLTSNSAIATISNGVLTAKAAGSCTITARSVSNPNIAISKQLLIVPISNSNACTINITSPGSGRQFVFLEDLMVKADISNSPDEVYFYYAASEDDISNTKCRKGTLKKLENSSYEKNGEVFNTYFGYWRPLPSNSNTSRESEWIKGQLSKRADDKYVWHMPKIIVEAVKNGGVSPASIPAYLRQMSFEKYKSFLKPNVDFNLERDIVGVATSYDGDKTPHNLEYTYNCLAYGVGIYNRWQWPWGQPWYQNEDEYFASLASLSKNKIKKYIEEDVILYNGKKYGSVDVVDVSYGEDGEINNTNSNFKTRIIYYTGGHFAKVLTYDKNGNPKKIRSKWGIGELIDSPNPNPFAVGEFLYGNAKYLINSSAATIEFNDYHKEYYNATDFIWDNVNKRYIDKDFYPLGTSNSFIGMPIKDYRYQWLENNKDSQNPLDKAILQYCEESKLDTSLVRRSYYSPQDDKQLHIITDLGIQCVPEMLDEIKTKHPFSGLLMTAIEEITKISPELVDVSNDGINKWVAAFNERISSAPYIVNTSISMLEQNINNDTLDKVKESISNIGIISIPYIPKNTNVESVKLMEVLEGMYGENTISTYKNNSDNSILLENTVHKLYEQTQEPDLGNCKIVLYEPCRALGEAGYRG